MISAANELEITAQTSTSESFASDILDDLKTTERQIGRQVNIANPRRLYNVPVIRNENSCKHGFLNSYTEERRRRFTSEMEKQHVGPMPVEAFLQEFLPAGVNGDDTRMPAVEKAFDSVPSFDTNEANLYEPLCRALNSSRCPSLQFVDTSDNAEDPGYDDPVPVLKPALCLYADNVVARFQKTDGKYIPHLGYADLFVEVTAKGNDPFDKDPISETDSTGHKLIKWPEDQKGWAEVKKEIGQIVSYASELCARQHRTHCFSIFICGPEARLIRWDRAGAIVSRSFNYKEDPQRLCLFVWRYSKATDAQRGFDMTVQKALPEEEKKFEEVVKKHVKEQLCLEEGMLLNNLVRDHYKRDNVFKIAVDPRHPRTGEIPKDNSEEASSDAERDSKLLASINAARAESGELLWDEAWYEDEGMTAMNDKSGPPTGCNTPRDGSADSTADADKQADERSKPISRCRKHSHPQYFLVSRPVSFPASIAGRGTRGYRAVKLPDQSVGEEDFEIAFLKDTWRDCGEGMEIEGEVMVELVEAGVKFVSDVFCQGDVRQGGGESDCADGSTSKYQVTLTDKYAKAGWNCNERRITAQTHYRVASVEVGYGLRTMKGTKELMHGTRCSFLGAWAAYVLCRRLHRDISLDNIILVRKRGRWRVGFLIDWELSSRADRDGKAHDYARSGTWAFMSIASLIGADKNFRHSFKDDMESFYYVVLYASILWLPHNDVSALKQRIEHFFNEYQNYGGEGEGGNAKFFNRHNGRFYKRLKWENELLRDWIEEALKLQKETDDKQPNWTPEALHSLWKATDKNDLPAEDRFDHPLKDECGRTIVEPNTYPANLTSSRAHESQASTGSVRVESPLRDAAPCKRNRDAAGFEEDSVCFKRQRDVVLLPSEREE